MLSSDLILGIIGIGGLGIGGLTTSYLLVNSKNKFSVKSLVTKDTSRTIASSSEDWNKIWEEYKKENKDKPKGLDSWKINEWRDNNPGTIPFSYKNRCTAFGRYRIEDENNIFYKHFIKYCTLPKNNSHQRA